MANAKIKALMKEFEEVKKHAQYGFDILRTNENISMVSAYIAYGHHERLDGSGYPDKLAGEKIHEYTRIVSVCDVYDALTSDRIYRKKLKPNEVYEYITSLGSHHFDQKVVDIFVRHVSIYPVGSGVVLNTKEKGLVVKTNASMPTRPIVRVLYNGQNQKLSNYYELDLSKAAHLNILDACEL